MSGIGTGYDLSTTTYSLDGKVFQVDYACKAVDNGGLALGVRCKDGVVLGVEKLLAMKMLVLRHWSAVAPTASGPPRGHGGHGPRAGRAPDRRAREIGVRAVPLVLRRPDPGADLGGPHGARHAPLHPYWSARPPSERRRRWPSRTRTTATRDVPAGALGRVPAVPRRGDRQGAAGGEERDREAGPREPLAPPRRCGGVARIVYATHDEKDKEFECELSWICGASGGEFKRVPKNLVDEAAEAARRAARESDDEMDAMTMMPRWNRASLCRPA